MRTRRVWLLVNIAITVALVPALFIARAPDDKKPVSVLQSLPVVATAAPGSNAVVILSSAAPVEETTTTTTTSTTSTTAARPKPTTTTTVRHTVVTAAPNPKPKPTTPTTAKPNRPKPQNTGNSETGKGSWYDNRPGICAHKTLPFGTVVTVTDTDNGRSVTCTVGDRGPYVEGWVIDLNPREFRELAPQSSGVINVKLTW